VIADGIFALIEPMEHHKKTAKELEKISRDLKNRLLEQAQKAAFFKTCSSSEFSHLKHKATSITSTLLSFGKSYITGLAEKILNNIEVKITNVHARYEDSQSIPSQYIAGNSTRL
jgi:hypothetical protein